MLVKDYFNFISKIDMRSDEECWNWIGGFNGKIKKYGRIRIKGKRYLTHRLSWAIMKGDVPEGLFVCHKCDNHKCVNPKHLWLGTIKENNNDRDKKGRFNALQGEDNGLSKFTNEQALEIRSLSGIISQRKLAAKFSVSRTTIENIIHKRTYKYI